ncbi:MAG: asparagine synthase (glutamine-hydrolyzing) [Roseiflexaceae bacterium]
MCGITGWLDWEADPAEQRALVAQMAHTLRHRGPDADGLWAAGPLALAHRRLVVIDPAGGVQPMVHQQGQNRYVISYNGELYNFRELRRELQNLGHVFRTNSDTEVLLQAYVAWGEGCLQRLVGMFAFAIWDEARQQLLLARDHMGIKPLFYAQRGSALLFGSELKALLAHPLVQPEVDAQGLAEIFTWAKTPGLGIYRNVSELRPGHALLANREGQRITQFWRLQSAPHTDDLDTTIERLRAMLSDSVRSQLVADVPLVSLLSGGVDSSGLAALAARELGQHGRSLHTYTIDFVNSSRDFQADMLRSSLDAPWAQQVAQHIGTLHHTITLDTTDLLEHMLAPMRARDLPSAGTMDTALYLLFKQMKQQATVAISGESADEVFGGYFWFVNPQAALGINSLPWVPAVGFAQLLSAEARARLDPDAYVARRYQEALAELPPPAEGQSETPIDAKMRELFYLSQTRFISIFMDRKDRASMASGFEVRVPYCDHRIVEYLWNVPWQMKATNQIEKGLLREAFAGLLPDEVRQRRKSAFPISRNPSYLQALRQIVQDTLEDSAAPIRPLIDLGQARALLAGDVPAERLSWTMYYLDSIIQVNNWLSEYRVRLAL